MKAPTRRIAACLGCAVLLAATAVPAVAQDPAPPDAGGIPACEPMTTTASGLEWGVLRAGRDGKKPTLDDSVVVHYTGWLPNGTKFDSSRDRGQPFETAVTGVIKGWTEALQLMTPGTRLKLVIPGDLAYGERGFPPKIGANQTLVFDVELIGVLPKLRPANPDEQQSTEDDVKYEVLEPGTGPMCGDDQGVALRYAYWRADGQLLDCSLRRGDQKIGGTLDSLPLPFMKGLFQGARQGLVVRVEVPQSVFPRAGADTVWELEVVSVNDVPKFRALDQDAVVTTQSGLKYEAIEQGDGDSPTATSKVLAHYTGWLTDGTLFDSSHARGEPIEFPLNGVIAGWTEGLQLMKPGGVFLFEIPSELGYGSRDMGKIPPNSTLIFLVELKSFK